MLNVSLQPQKAQNVSFGRKLKEQEQKAYQQTIQQALKQLDKNNLSVIAHGPSFPSVSSEDTGIGSPYTGGAMNFMNFLSDLGFNSVQLGPGGKTKRSDASPYTSTVFSDNSLFIDLKALTTPQWAGLLSEVTLNSVVDNNKNKDKSLVNYEYAYDRYTEALSEAWGNFKAKVDGKPELSAADRKVVGQLQQKFEAFQKKNEGWLENDALYEALAKANGNDYWGNWSETDKALPRMLVSADPAEREKAQKRLDEVRSTPELMDEINFYKFCQFVLNEQKETIQKQVPLKTIADIQVTYSDRDWWAFQNLFLDDYSLGVPPDYFSKDGQAWGFPVIDPDQLFERTETGEIKKENGRPVLGESGKLIKVRFDKMFKDNPGGVRIDHIVGLIDPWVYPKKAKTAKVEDGGRRLFSSPEAGEPFKKWAHIGNKDINIKDDKGNKITADRENRVKEESMKGKVVDNYAGIIDIIKQSAEDNNVPISNIICEDLGTLTTPVAAVLKDRGLSGLRVTEFADPHNPKHMYQGKNVASKQWVVTGTHDNDTLISWVDELGQRKDLKPHADYLAKDLKLDSAKLQKDSKEFIKAKFAELFASPAQNVQLMFTDVFGMKDRYNNPGARKPEELSKNWRIRVPNNFSDFYQEQLSKGFGLNLPEVLMIAMNSKDKDFVSKNKDLIGELKKFAGILKEPEQK